MASVRGGNMIDPRQYDQLTIFLWFWSWDGLSQVALLPLSSPICRTQAEGSRQLSVPSVFMTFYKIHVDGRKEFVSSPL